MGLEKLGLKEGDVVRLNTCDREIKTKLIEINFEYERFVLIARQEGGGIFHYHLPFFYTKKNKEIVTSTFIARGYVGAEEDIYPKLDRELKDVSL